MTGHRWRRGLLAALFLPLAAGCAGTGTGGPGSDLIQAGRYDEVVTMLAAEAERNPSDARVQRNLGIARYKAGDASRAVEDLSRARSMNEKDLHTLFFLGRAAEAVPDYGKAVDAYGAYLARKPDDVEVRTRLREVNLKRLRAEVEEAIRRERELSAGAIPENTVAVLEFRNLSNAPELASLGKGLSAMVTGDLARVRRFQVVEREKVPILMSEINLGSATVDVKPQATTTSLETVKGIAERLAAIPRGTTGRTYLEGPPPETETPAFLDAVRNFQRDHDLQVDGKVGPRTRAAVDTAYRNWLAQGTIKVRAVDPASAPRAGKLLGARLLVQGGYNGSLTTPLTIDAGMTESTTGAARGSGADAGGPLAELFRMEKEIVFELLDQLDVELSDEEKDAIGRPPTTNIDAFIAWSDGLAYEDSGRPDLARQSFQRAVQIDPGFQVAQASLDAVSGTPDGFSSLEQSVFEATLAGGAGGAGGGSDDALLSRLDQGSVSTGWGLTPGRAAEESMDGDQLDPIVAPVAAAAGMGTVIIVGEVPR